MQHDPLTPQPAPRAAPLRAIPICLALCLALVAPYAGADECVPTRSDQLSLPSPGTSIPLSAAGGADTYVDWDIPFGVWVYTETNGVEGLQRGDETVTDEHCGAGPDAIVI